MSKLNQTASLFFLLSGSQAYAEAPTTSPLGSSPRIAHFLGPKVGFALSGNLPFLSRSLHRRFLALASAPHPKLSNLGDLSAAWANLAPFCVFWAEFPAKMIMYLFVGDNDGVKTRFAQERNLFYF